MKGFLLPMYVIMPDAEKIGMQQIVQVIPAGVKRWISTWWISEGMLKTQNSST